VPLHLKIAAGLTTGALAITVASPTDLVKVRMQAEGKLPAGTPKKYPSAMSAYSIIAKCAPPMRTMMTLDNLGPLDICALDIFLWYVSPCPMDLLAPENRCRCLNICRFYGKAGCATHQPYNLWETLAGACMHVRCCLNRDVPNRFW
jgi:hypothetical protein